MALVQYLFEGGSEGATVNNANSGSSASSVNGGTHVFAAEAKAHGALGFGMTNASGAGTFRRYPFAGGTTTTVFQFSGVVTLPAQAPLQNASIVSLPNSSGSARLAVAITPNSKLVITDVGSAHYVNLADITWGAKYRITIEAVGGSTTASQVTAHVYSGTTSWDTPIGTPLSANNWNMSTDNIIGVDVGVVSSPGAIALMAGWDDVQLNDGAGSEIGDIVEQLVTPVVTLGAATNPSTVGGVDGSQVVTWAAVPGASSYEAWIANGASPAQGDFTLVATGVTSPYTFTGLTAGERAYGIKAKA